MGKYNIDDILSQLGVNGEDAPVRRTPPKEEPRKVHTIDKAEDSFSPLPPMPAHQKRAAGDDPAVKQKRDTPAAPAVGDAISDIYKPEETALAAPGGDLADLLLARGAASAEQLTTAKNVVKQSPGRRLVDILVENGADETAIQRVVADHAGVPFERIDLDKGLDGGFDGRLLQRLTPDFCKQNLVLPLRTEGQRVVVGATRPEDVFLRDEIGRRLGVPSVKLVLVTAYDVRGALDIVGALSGEADAAENFDELLADVSEADVEVTKETGNLNDLEQKAGEGPVIRYVNHIIQEAIKQGASDIHIEPQEKKLRVRFRIDGVLFEVMNPPAGMSAAITSRLKIMANLDIAERRLPQDGRIRCTVQGRKLDLRMSTIPTAVGEKVVLRILDTRSINRNLEELGFDETMLHIWKQQVDAPHGIVLVTGPTGSGKTTTLYASLRTLDKAKLNISTVEDPVEYHLDGITQTQAHEKIGMTFATALRALLRQDPDVIMLGEIRDMETAGIAIQAALTGHLVLSTLHTNDAPGSVTRLINIGIEPFLVGAALNAVLAQRLIRRLCVHCKFQDDPSDDLREFLAMQALDSGKIWTSKGCERCRGTGYSGRVGIYEMLVIDDQMKDIIARNPNVAEFRRLCLERGMVSLLTDGMRKVAQGLTTIEEVLRATTEGH